MQIIGERIFRTPELRSDILVKISNCVWTKIRSLDFINLHNMLNIILTDRLISRIK